MSNPPEAETALNDDVKPFEEKKEISLSNASHPTACLFTFLFKAIAFTLYHIHSLSYLLLFGLFDDI